MTCPCGDRIRGANRIKQHGVWRHKVCSRHKDQKRKIRRRNDIRAQQRETLATMMKEKKPLSLFWQTMKGVFGRS